MSNESSKQFVKSARELMYSSVLMQRSSMQISMETVTGQAL